MDGGEQGLLFTDGGDGCDGGDGSVDAGVCGKVAVRKRAGRWVRVRGDGGEPTLFATCDEASAIVQQDSPRMWVREDGVTVLLLAGDRELLIVPDGGEWETGVYIILNKINGKVYVGSASRSTFSQRWAGRAGHLPALLKGSHYNQRLQHSWNKHGECNFVFVAFIRCPWPIAKTVEDHWIAALDSCNPDKGYNICPNAHSTLGRRHTEEAKRAMSEKVKERCKDPEYRAKLSAGQRKASQNPATRERRRAAAKRRSANPVWRANASDAQRKRVADPAVRAEMSRRATEQAAKPGAREAMAERARRQWEDEEFREKWMETRKGRCADPEARKAMSARSKQQWEDEEFREKATKAAKERASRPETRKKMSEGQKRRYERQEEREKASKRAILRHLGYSEDKKAEIAEKLSNCMTPERVKQMHDANSIKGTTAKGEANWNAKLSVVDVVAILCRRAKGESLQQLAVDFCVNKNAISRIARRERWKHVDKEYDCVATYRRHLTESRTQRWFPYDGGWKDCPHDEPETRERKPTEGLVVLPWDGAEDPGPPVMMIQDFARLLTSLAKEDG